MNSGNSLIPPEEAHYGAVKGTIERSGKNVDSFTNPELKTFFKASDEDIKKLRTNNEPLKEFKEKIGKWLHIDDGEVLDIVLASMISEKVGGDPLWLFLIAPPGGSKTELLRSFNDPEYFHHLSDMTSKTLITGLMVSDEGNKEKKSRKIEDLLPQLNGKTLIFKDFTTILEKGRDERRELISQFRECYDGYYAKKVGTVDKTISYSSRFGLIAGVTPVIDSHWKIMQQLGERFLKVRWKENPDLVTKRSRKNESHERIMREDLIENSNSFIANLDQDKKPKFNDEEFGDFISDIAKFIAHARTPISFNGGANDFYFENIPTPEIPTRLVKQLKKMSKCLALVRGKPEVDSKEIESLLRIAKDSIPQDRLAVLEIIDKFQKGTITGCPRKRIYSELKIPQTSIRRILDQLDALEMIIVEKSVNETYDYSQETFNYKTNELWGNIFGTLPEKLGVVKEE